MLPIRRRNVQRVVREMCTQGHNGLMSNNSRGGWWDHIQQITGQMGPPAYQLDNDRHYFVIFLHCILQQPNGIMWNNISTNLMSMFNEPTSKIRSTTYIQTHEDDANRAVLTFHISKSFSTTTESSKWYQKLWQKHIPKIRCPNCWNLNDTITYCY